MRVVGGAARGRRMRGAVISGVRPTSELVRGAIFNVLAPLDLTPIRVLDLYAGSGSLGIEALSRGAAWADFVERHPRQCAVIRENLESIGFADRGQVHCMKVEAAYTTLRGPYMLVLMDPPYKLASLDGVLEALAGSDLLGDGATLVVGHSSKAGLKDGYRDLRMTGSYRYGDSAVDFFEKGGQESP